MAVPTAVDTAQEQGGRRTLFVLTIVLVLCMSTWFSASAVVPQLRDTWVLTATSSAWLTIAVQVGFVVGALLSAVTNLADRLAPRHAVLLGATGAAGANALLLVVAGPGLGIPLRFATGFFLAAVYPPVFKLAATWFRARRGMALGVLAGAIVVGNSMPHLVNALGGLDWQVVIIATSVMTSVGGLLAWRGTTTGPHPFPRSTFDIGAARSALANRGVRLATFGYIGHMWELFGLYAWIGVFFADHLTARGTTVGVRGALAAFAVIAIGGPGSWLGGVLSDRWGRTTTTAGLLMVSGTCSLVVGLLFGGPTWLLLVVALVWGVTSVADSAQFSTIVTEVGEQSSVGTALTVQMAMGFTVTVATIWLVPVLESAVGWRWAFAVLAIGPAAGTAAMLRLRSLPEAAQLAGGRG